MQHVLDVVAEVLLDRPVMLVKPVGASVPEIVVFQSVVITMSGGSGTTAGVSKTRVRRMIPTMQIPIPRTPKATPTTEAMLETKSQGRLCGTQRVSLDMVIGPSTSR